MMTRWQEFGFKALDNLNYSRPIPKVSRILEVRLSVWGIPSKPIWWWPSGPFDRFSVTVHKQEPKLIIYRQHCPTILRLWISPQVVQRPMRYLVNSLKLFFKDQNPWTSCCQIPQYLGFSWLSCFLQESHLFSRQTPLRYPLHCVKGDSRVGAVLSKFRRASESETAWRMISTH